MPIDFQGEQLLTLSDAAKALPPRRAGKRTATSTLFRWASRGLRGEKLEVIRVGGVTCTSMEALQRFFDRLTNADHAAVDPPHEDQEVEVELEELGLGLDEDE